MASPATIRRSRAADASAISALVQQYVPPGTLLPRSPAFIAERSIDFLVAVLDGRVVGCVHVEEYSPSLAEIRSLVVEPASQGQGIGLALVNEAEQVARIRGYTTLFAVSNNDAFFASRGFLPRQIPELDRERSEVSRFKGVYAKDLADSAASGPLPAAKGST